MPRNTLLEVDKQQVWPSQQAAQSMKINSFVCSLSCMADLFGWIGFYQTSNLLLFNISKAAESKQVKQEVSRAAILPL